MIDIVILILLVCAIIIGIISLLKKPQKNDDILQVERRLMDELRASRQESSTAVSASLSEFSEIQGQSQRTIADMQDKRLRELSQQLTQRQAMLQTTVGEQMQVLDRRFKDVSLQNENKMENIRKTMDDRLAAIQTGNEKKLDEMRNTVDEKLHTTLDERLKQNFSLVNDRLEQVYKGLGEMQSLATGVGDLKKVLSNVKTRGILGEIQLGAILEEILAPEQYATNVETVKGSGARVEFAVKLPGDGETPVWLPIDAKFPADPYAKLLEAYDLGEPEAVLAASKVLERSIRDSAKSVRDKYIQVPETTEFAIIFLPIEGLFAEVVRLGLVESLQNEFKINIAGPTTMAAMLNSLQMGFRTLAIQKRSSEVWKLLNEVQTEFGKFSTALEKTQERIKTAGDELETLVGTRTRVMNRKLKGVSKFSTKDDDDEDTLLEVEE